MAPKQIPMWCSQTEKTTTVYFLYIGNFTAVTAEENLIHPRAKLFCQVYDNTKYTPLHLCAGMGNNNKKKHIKINKNHTFKLANRHNSPQKKNRRRRWSRWWNDPLCFTHARPFSFDWGSLCEMILGQSGAAAIHRFNIWCSTLLIWMETGTEETDRGEDPHDFFCFTKLPCQDASLVPSSFPLHRSAHSYSPTPYIKQCIYAKQLNCHWTWTQSVTNESSVFVFMV